MSEPQQQQNSGLPYNLVFQKLVDNSPQDQQLVGLVAYGLYKIAKREWVMQLQKEHADGPSPDHHRQFAAIQTETILDGYRSQATEIVAAYANSVVQSERPAIQRDALKGSFSKSVWASFIGGWIFAISLGLLAFVIANYGNGLPAAFSRFFPTNNLTTGG